MTDQALGTTVLLSDEEASLSKQVINDYFPLAARRLGTSDNEPDDEELTSASKVLENTILRNYEPEGTTATFWGRMKAVVQELITWESALVAFVVLLVLAHLWNLVELTALELEVDDNSR
ncbi:hypothetical protein V7S43_005142 [Phytophthora oleae]|uniref:Uncharacterized protein n=1 Tax=Phytophthora oleae TaxID=2107226 RepID=A0ABD3FVS3_9STRA